MGLAGMKVLPDHAGMQVRGQSIAITFSFSTGNNILSIGSPISVAPTTPLAPPWASPAARSLVALPAHRPTDALGTLVPDWFFT